MSPRRCPDCGVAEERIVVGAHYRVNLDPVTGRCVDCLVRQSFAAKRASAGFDWKAAQSGREREE